MWLYRDLTPHSWATLRISTGGSNWLWIRWGRRYSRMIAFGPFSGPPIVLRYGPLVRVTLLWCGHIRYTHFKD